MQQSAKSHLAIGEMRTSFVSRNASRRATRSRALCLDFDADGISHLGIQSRGGDNPRLACSRSTLAGDNSVGRYTRNRGIT
jgi:hypothetical protein